MQIARSEFGGSEGNVAVIENILFEGKSSIIGKYMKLGKFLRGGPSKSEVARVVGVSWAFDRLNSVRSLNTVRSTVDQ